MKGQQVQIEVKRPVQLHAYQNGSSRNRNGMGGNKKRQFGTGKYTALRVQNPKDPKLADWLVIEVGGKAYGASVSWFVSQGTRNVELIGYDRTLPARVRQAA